MSTGVEVAVKTVNSDGVIMLFRNLDLPDILRSYMKPKF